MDFNTYDNGLQVVVSESGEVTSLDDRRFPWIEKRGKAVHLAQLYDKAGYPEFAQRAGACATWLQYGVFADGTKQLQAANFCQLRLCPMCISRRAKKNAYQLSRVLDQVEAEHDAMFLFLTLTIKNVPGDQLGDAIRQLTNSWTKLIKHRQIERSIGGWFRAVEITRGDNRWHKNRKTQQMEYRPDRGYHPHIHAILAVSPAYFARKSGLYISHEEWLRRWKLAFGSDYAPSVRIQTAKKKGEYCAGKAAAVEAAKYAVKDEEYIDPELPEERLIEILTDYTDALHRKRLTAFGGWMKDAARELKADKLDEDTDLVHVDEDSIREDVAELIETYNWHFGAGDYILSRRETNPLKVVPVAGKPDDGRTDKT